MPHHVAQIAGDGSRRATKLFKIGDRREAFFADLYGASRPDMPPWPPIPCFRRRDRVKERLNPL